ncbi:hypothetical protein BOTBODRAFT_29828 [Botryobasidium botryosum FD-172 SS1]|uniref:Uncharacterized protein n=1 Tax=Botryobasidium botryosum (strain FD-172 SS1) TaxID=930990 RepID=A0A067N0G6_BOTB1|nr:hypothetical protein BOTBODRAFT_29828 [Botryobasidium botryosum FD-172 SS1]
MRSRIKNQVALGHTYASCTLRLLGAATPSLSRASLTPESGSRSLHAHSSGSAQSSTMMAVISDPRCRPNPYVCRNATYRVLAVHKQWW